jgi:hypothetical protein
MRVAFVAGTEPRTVCPAFHAPSLFDWESSDSTGIFDHETDHAPEEHLPPTPGQEDQEPPPSDDRETPPPDDW